VADAVVDWNGGTRIGESLRELNRRWVRRTVRSGAVVLLVSDGWERGDPALLARETATLRRSCARLLWLDPLAARPGFAPEVAGLRAVLDHVDELIPCASVAGLTRLAARLRMLCAGPRRPTEHWREANVRISIPGNNSSTGFTDFADDP
jgi:hypothetical protein